MTEGLQKVCRVKASDQLTLLTRNTREKTLLLERARISAESVKQI